MRLWHKDLIPLLPTMQLKWQWRECCLIAKGLHDGNLNHILVNRVKDYPIEHFIAYTEFLRAEMLKRGFKCNGKCFTKHFNPLFNIWNTFFISPNDIFPDWHNDRYLRQCLYNLEEKAMAGGVPFDEWQKIYNAYGKQFDLWSGNE